MEPFSHTNDQSSREEEDDEVDRLSELPDDVLINILQQLDLRAAVRTSAVSRRWRQLPRMLPDLVMDVADFLTPRDGNDDQSPSPCTLHRAMAAYTDATRWLLPAAAQRRRPIKSMRLRFYLWDPYLCSIGRAVGDAVECRSTERLEFTLETEASAAATAGKRNDIGYTCCYLRALYAERFMSFFVACPLAFSRLTGLTLQYLHFSSSDDVPNLINTCSKLERLSLSYCSFDFDCVLEIDAPSSQLAALEIRRCDYQRVELIRVPELRRLLCDVWYHRNPPVRFGHVPRLHSIKFSSKGFRWQKPFTLSDWLSSTRNVSELHLDFLDGKIWIKPENPKQLSLVFKNLVDVHLCNIHDDRNLDWTLFILEAAPSLKNFYVKLSEDQCGMKKWKYIADKTSAPWDTSKFEHRNLSLLEVAGFESRGKLMQYVRRVIECAVCLKRVCLLRGGSRDTLIAQQYLTRQMLTNGLRTHVEIFMGPM